MLLGKLLNKTLKASEEITKEEALAEFPPKKAKRYSVILENNEYTPFEVVIITLMKVMSFSEDIAKECAMHIHENGHAVLIKDIPRNRAQKIQEEITEYTKAGGRYPPAKVIIEPS